MQRSFGTGTPSSGAVVHRLSSSSVLDMSFRRDPGLVYVLVEQWQFQCCGDTPEVGGQVSYPIRAYPPTPPVGPWVVDSPSWVPGRRSPNAVGRLARFGTGAGDAGGDRGVVRIFNHVPAGAGIEGVRDRSGQRTTVTDNRGPPLAGGPSARRAEGRRGRRRDSSRVGSRTGRRGGRRVSDEVERNRRTLILTGLPEAFGSLVPEVGARLSVDVSDPRLDVVGEVADGPVVAGEALQVSWAISDAHHGITVYADPRSTVRPGTPLMIRLLQDRQP